MGEWADTLRDKARAGLPPVEGDLRIERLPQKPVEYEVLGLDPSPLPTGEDGAAYASAFSAFMAWTLSNNWDNELLRWTIAEQLGFEAMQALFPDVETQPAVVTAGKH